MKLIILNKYLLKNIFSYVNHSKELNIIKYNKKFQSKREISLYTYQKHYFHSIISPAIMNNIDILYRNKIFDKKLLNKLLSDWEKETSEIIKDNQIFLTNKGISKKNKNVTNILNISKENKINFYSLSNLPSLLELNLSEIKNIEIPTSILLKLQKFFLVNISNLKFVNDLSNNNISMNELKYLYINNISFDEKNDNNIKISYNNLKYLDLRLKEQDGFDDEYVFDNNNNKAGFYKENTIETLINIFNFQFLNVFPIDTKKYVSELEDYEAEDDPFTFEKYNYLANVFKAKDKELFLNKDILKLDYFYFEILDEYYRVSGSAEFNERFIYQYIFSKTKGNKYLFKVIYNDYNNCNGDLFDITNEEIRYCDNHNFNEFYLYDNKLNVKQNSLYYKIENIENIKSLNLCKNINDYEGCLNQFKKNKNNVEVISINLNLINNNIILNFKNFSKLKSFSLEINYSFNDNKQVIELLNSLSKFKNLFWIEIKFNKKLKLSRYEIDKIKKMFNGISIEIRKNNCIIKWNNNNLKFNDFKKINN